MRTDVKDEVLDLLNEAIEKLKDVRERPPYTDTRHIVKEAQDLIKEARKLLRKGLLIAPENLAEEMELEKSILRLADEHYAARVGRHNRYISLKP